MDEPARYSSARGSRPHQSKVLISRKASVSEAAVDASRVYARNLANLVALLVKDGALVVDLEDEVVRGALVAHEGRVVAEAVRARLGG